MTQYDPARDLIDRGGIGGQARQPGTGTPGRGGQRGGPPGGRGSGGRPGGGGPGGGRPPQGPRGGGGQQGQRLPEGYLEGGYFDDKGNLRPSLVVDDAYKVAQILSRRDGRKELTTAQLRRFFNKVRLIEQKLDAGQPFESVVAEVYQMQPLAANAVAKDGGPPEVFKEFIDKNVKCASRSERDFKEGFIKHFESVVAYFAYLKPR